jgi:hypothetical protein
MTTQKYVFDFEVNPGASRTHPRGTAILRSVRKITLLLTMVIAGALPSAAQTSLLNTYFKNIQLSQEEVAAIERGQSVAKTLTSRIPDEIFVVGAVYINSAPEDYLKFANDFDRIRKLPDVLALMRFTNPPQLSDLKGWELDSDDIKALKKCKVGDCALQVPAKSIEDISKLVDWSSPDANQKVNQIVQKRILEGLLAYQREGNQVLGVYNDKKDPVEVAGHFKYMLSYAKALPQILPGFYNYLLDYPASKPANVDDTFYWTKVKFGLKPTRRIVHVLTLRGTNAEEPAYAVAEKQLYSSHYFETALDLTYCIRKGNGPKSTGFYLIKAMGSEQAGLTGFKGSIVRKAAVSRSASSLQKSLTSTKNMLEQKQ